MDNQDTPGIRQIAAQTSLTRLAHDLISETVESGDVVIDATVGNGHDTLFLAELVGPDGRVIGFDIQQQALNDTLSRLEQIGFAQRAKLLNISHEQLLEGISQAFGGRCARAIMFNLCYLPGGDKQLTTRAESSLQAMRQALELLCEDAILSVIAYPGHPAGLEEATEIRRFMQTLQPPYRSELYIVEHTRRPAPQLWVVRKKSHTD